MSNRKPYNDRAGYIASRKNKITNGWNVIYIAAEQGIDCGSKYAVVCESHSAIVCESSIPKARLSMKDSTLFCDDCRQIC